MKKMIVAQSFEVFDKELAKVTMKRKTGNPKIDTLFAAAEGGNHEAEALVGEHYYEGSDGFPFDRVEAMKWFVRSARGKNPLARVWIAIMTQSGEITSSATSKAQFRDILPDLTPYIGSRNTKAEYWRAMGECFAAGEDLSFDARQPKELLKKAIERGDLRAKLLMGDHIISNHTSVTEGIRYLRSASDGGCASASGILGSYYLGPGNDPRLAVRLFQSAANQNMAEAQLLLGSSYAKGKGLEKDEARAAFWLQLGLRNAVQQADNKLEVRIRETIRLLEPEIGKDNFRRAENFLKKKIR